MKKPVKRNYDIFSNYDFYVPGVADLFILIAWLAVGAILGNIATLVVMACMGSIGDATQYATLIAYPLMFIPAMMYAGYKSMGNSTFGPGAKLDSSHFKPLGGAFCAILVVFATLAASFVSEIFTSILPPMPQWLESTLQSMTQGQLWLDLICVSIFAPLFEEWLCRGMVLRGLLYAPRRGKDGEMKPGMDPKWAIIISAAFFAIIHLNPWQAIPAFLLGCLFGYVYYKTGSLKLTMLMHCTNNTFAVLMSHVDKFKDVETWNDVMSPVMYWAVFALCAAMLAYVISKFRTIEQNDAQGSCDRV